MSTREAGVQEWRDLPWSEIEKDVYSLQRRIYRASQGEDRKMVHRLQRLLMSSWSARCLAVRRVTQDNQGKRTAGVDGVASLEPEERLLLAETLDLGTEPRPVRRTWIPKPGTDEQRPLGIPTMHDRAAQALAKLALEPEWEARFEPNSYGFRPGRSAHDAVAAIFMAVRMRPKYVLDADIAKCFDRINHDALLDKLDTFPTMRRLVKAWLKAGVLDGGTLFPTEEGTPQGGVISPLLANVALHGLEQAIWDALPKTKKVNGRSVEWKALTVRYADDFVVLHHELDAVHHCKDVAQTWLRGMGLELKPSKTSICHTLSAYREDHDGNVVGTEDERGRPGFDFLGFTVRQFTVGKYHTGRDTTGKPLGFKTIIKPSKTKVKLHHQQLADIVTRLHGASQADLIKEMNPVIRGWCLYYRHVVSGATFNRLDATTFALLRRWCFRRHPTKGKYWVIDKYWTTKPWRFRTSPNGLQLRRHTDTRIVRHRKVVGEKSPYDGDWTYWVARQGTFPGVRPWLAQLLKRQHGRCSRCGLFFTPESVIERHHRDRDHGNRRVVNLEAMHRHCHDAEHRHGRSNHTECVRDKNQLPEEPDERESLTSGSEGQAAG